MDKFVTRLPKKKIHSRSSSSTATKPIIDKSTHKQSYLDCGQRTLGATRSCSHCNMVYIADDVDDCENHKQHCKKFGENVKLRSALKSNVIWEDCDTNSAVIKIKMNRINDIQTQYKTVIMRMLDDLGSSPDEFDSCVSSAATAFFFTESNRIVGIAVVEQVKRDDLVVQVKDSRACEKHISKRQRTNSSPQTPKKAIDMTFPLPSTIGIRQMWVDPQWRRRKVCFKLLDVIRLLHSPRVLVSRMHVAFSQPTDDGKLFAYSYVDKDYFWAYSFSTDV
mmetsp:Transcript_9997/g.15099  ORF Transcript_9997/g.15099 Transcript_9997/m.15099 type:complete len:278 (+) Transcript_9997:85-918(+)